MEIREANWKAEVERDVDQFMAALRADNKTLRTKYQAALNAAARISKVEAENERLRATVTKISAVKDYIAHEEAAASGSGSGPAAVPVPEEGPKSNTRAPSRGCERPTHL